MKIKVKALDRKQLALIADWAIAAVAVSLPWSTSATSILLVVWLLALLPTLDFAMVRREVETPAGGLPVLLWLLAAVGMLWAEVRTWADRIHGLGAFHRLLAIPLLLAQFRRSGHGVWVLYGFLASDSVLLLVSWALALTPGLPWRGVRHMVRIPSGYIIRKARYSSSARLLFFGACSICCASETGGHRCCSAASLYSFSPIWHS